MKPYNATIPIYAETEDEVKAFEKNFYDFVNEKRNQGIAVSAKKMSQALAMFKDNQYLNNFLKI